VISHVVLFSPKEDLGREGRRELLDALVAASATIPSIKRFRVGRRVKHGLPGYEQHMADDYQFAAIVEFDDLDGTTLLGLRRYGLSRSSRALKRALDIVGAGVGLVVAAPLWLGAAIAIKRSSSGPVLFRQRRIGREGREFSMLKLRTMVEGADEQKLALRWLNEADGLFKIADDPRMTPVGRFLRRTSLDELPQLVNVVRGEMSLVGPRPLVPEEDDRVEGWQRRRLQLYPGMTGIWQVFGSARIPLGEMVKIDYLYAANWSLWLDCKIMLQTVPHVLRRRGL